MKKVAALCIFILFCLLYVSGQTCVTADQAELANTINNFRISNNSTPLLFSFALCNIARQKAESVQEAGQEINFTPDLYILHEKMIHLNVKSIDANAKNTGPTFTMKHPSLEFWKVIIENGAFSGMQWKSVGIGFYKNTAVLAFSDKELNDKPPLCDDQNLNQQTEIVIPSNKELPVIGKGEWLIPPSYYKMAYLNFEPELFPVANDFEKWGYVNKKGKVVIDFQFQRAYAFAEGLAAVMNTDGLYGYINPGGTLIIPHKYDSPGQFYMGRALVSADGKNFLINKNGEKVSEEFTDMAWLNDNYYAFRQGNLYGIKDINGKLVKTPFFSDFYPFSEGLAGVKVQGNWGFMDENFNLVIKPAYTEKVVYAFQNGYARFKQNGKTGVLDKSGNIILPAQYDDLYEFSDGLMAFQQQGKWGYINLKGETVIYPEYLSAYNFKYGMAVVKDTRLKSHLIDVTNNKIIYHTDEIIVFSKNLIGVNTIGGWGLYELP